MSGQCASCASAKRVTVGVLRLAITAGEPAQIANGQLLLDIRRVHAQHRERYGAPRIHAKLRAEGHASAASGSRGSCAAMASGRGHRGVRVCTTDSKDSLPGENLLDRNFVADRLNKSGWPISPISQPARAGSTWP